MALTLTPHQCEALESRSDHRATARFDSAEQPGQLRNLALGNLIVHPPDAATVKKEVRTEDVVVERHDEAGSLYGGEYRRERNTTFVVDSSLQL
jgi:hypothetical protein